MECDDEHISQGNPGDIGNPRDVIPNSASVNAGRPSDFSIMAGF